jgi:hypothetical protein
MWGNPTRERERDIIIQLQESTVQQQNHISSQEKSLTTPKQSHQNLPRFSCQVRTVVRPSQKCSSSKTEPTTCCTDCSVCPATQNSSKLCQALPQNSCPFLLLYGLYGSVQYDLQQQKNNSATKHKIFPWDLCPSSLGKCALFAAHFPLSSLLRKSLSITSSRLLDVSCTLPNAFFYKSENDIFPPKCLFTFPNPKSKGQD